MTLAIDEQKNLCGHPLSWNGFENFKFQAFNFELVHTSLDSGFTNKNESPGICGYWLYFRPGPRPVSALVIK